jgi:hypothetical protein
MVGAEGGSAFNAGEASPSLEDLAHLHVLRPARQPELRGSGNDLAVVLAFPTGSLATTVTRIRRAPDGGLMRAANAAWPVVVVPDREKRLACLAVTVTLNAIFVPRSSCGIARETRSAYRVCGFRSRFAVAATSTTGAVASKSAAPVHVARYVIDAKSSGEPVRMTLVYFPAPRRSTYRPVPRTICHVPLPPCSLRATGRRTVKVPDPSSHENCRSTVSGSTTTSSTSAAFPEAQAGPDAVKRPSWRNPAGRLVSGTCAPVKVKLKAPGLAVAPLVTAAIAAQTAVAGAQCEAFMASLRRIRQRGAIR